jgi:hypothetical protein
LLAEHPTSSAHSVIRAIKVHSANTVPVFYFVVETAGLGWDAGIGNHDIQTTKVLDSLGNGGLYSVVVANIHLVSLGLDIEFFGDGGDDGIGVLGGMVPNGNLRDRGSISN